MQNSNAIGFCVVKYNPTTNWYLSSHFIAVFPEEASIYQQGSTFHTTSYENVWECICEELLSSEHSCSIYSYHNDQLQKGTGVFWMDGLCYFFETHASSEIMTNPTSDPNFWDCRDDESINCEGL
jgi:hypothetical protein